MKVLVFGKKGCDLCKNRLSVVEGVKNKFFEDLEIKYYDAKTPEGLTEFAMLGLEVDIPSVVLLDKKDRVLSSWIGPKSVVTTKTLKQTIETGGKNG